MCSCCFNASGNCGRRHGETRHHMIPSFRYDSFFWKSPDLKKPWWISYSGRMEREFGRGERKRRQIALCFGRGIKGNHHHPSVQEAGGGYANFYQKCVTFSLNYHKMCFFFLCFLFTHKNKKQKEKKNIQ